MSATKEPIKLRIPRQDLAQFDLFGLSADQCSRWAESTAMGQADQAAKTLLGAVSDLNRVALPPQLRFELLEVLRARAHLALSNLSRYYLNQPVTLPEEPRRAAQLAQSLNDHLVTGYTIVGIHAIKERDTLSGTNPARLLCLAMHRAITSATQRLLISYQLYRPAEVGLWGQLHQLYLLAQRQQLTSQAVPDELWGQGSVRDTYLRALMLGSSKPNQLRQRDLVGIFAALGDWARQVRLLDPGEGDGLFLVDLARDQAPVYAALYTDVPGPGCQLLDTGDLVSRLRKLAEQSDDKPLVFENDFSVPANVLDHLITAWSVTSKRSFARAPAQEKLWVSVGLSNAHYYVAGGVSFHDVIAREASDTFAGGAQEENPFIRSDDSESDIWDRAFDAEHEGGAVDLQSIEFNMGEADRPDHDEILAERHPVYPARMINVGPGGYCMEWPYEFPSHIKTGEILAVREVENRHWSIAVISWINHLRRDTTLIGVELLSPRATPCAVRAQLGAKEGSDWMRALLLPEIKLVGQPGTLLVSRMGFRERQKLALLRDGQTSYLQLFRRVSATASYSQFEFRNLDNIRDGALSDPGAADDKPFDSLWSKI
jgi:hypothetical protein